MEVKNIYQKMDMVRVKVGIIAKNINMQLSFNNGYKAVSETDVIKAVNEAEHEVGLVSYQYGLDIVESEKVASQRGTLFRIRVMCKMKVVNIDNPAESVEFVGLGDGIDSSDKATGKANTYAMKYALLRGYKIPTGEDPDYFKSEEMEELATEEDISLYISLVGAENVEHSCKRLGVNDLHELSHNKIQERIKNLQQRRETRNV